MGLLSWLFPSREERILRGQTALTGGHWRDARDEVEGLDGRDADDIRHAANNGLAQLNLQAAIDFAHSGGDERVAEHLALAETLHQGGLESQFQDTRRQLRQIREERRNEDAKLKSEAARANAVDPLGLVGRGVMRDSPRLPDLSPDDHEREARSALIVENYPPSLRASAVTLGNDFVDAVLSYEDGRPDLALQALLALPDAQPLVVYERARCAITLDDPKSAIAGLRAFAELAGGHQVIGAEHTATMLAQLLARSGDLDGSERVLTDNPIKGAEVLLAQVLHAKFRRGRGRGSVDEALLARAERSMLDAIARVGKKPELYVLLSDIRLDGGHRVPAMQALENALTACCDNPAKCGYRPPDPAIKRSLATLYLEDGLETARALELADDALAKVESASWEDTYLDALVLRAHGDPDAIAALTDIAGRVPAEDARRERVMRQIPAR